MPLFVIAYFLNLLLIFSTIGSQKLVFHGHVVRPTIIRIIPLFYVTQMAN
jgi:hypothetical protein